MKRLIALFFLLPFAVFAADVQPITPVAAGSKTISCTSSSAATILPSVAFQNQLELQNAGSVPIFVEVGLSTVTAAVATGYPVLPGQSKVISVSNTITHIACIVAVTTTTLYVTVGTGN